MPCCCRLAARTREVPLIARTPSQAAVRGSLRRPLRRPSIPASSGRTHRHRLNRGGTDRPTPPSAAWCSAACAGPPAPAYIRRAPKKDLTKRDIMRCLKRPIARELYYLLQSPNRTIDSLTIHRSTGPGWLRAWASGGLSARKCPSRCADQRRIGPGRVEFVRRSWRGTARRCRPAVHRRSSAG